MLLEKYGAVDEMYVWEAYNHGDAALINANNLGDTFDWADGARDVLQFLTFHRPLVHQRNAPTHLPHHAREDCPRPVIGVGHSHGGEIITRAALHDPTLFSALILIDPVIMMETLSTPTRRESMKNRDELLLRRTLARRAVWPSREEAEKFFAQAPFFRSHHPAVLSLYVSHGLASLPTSAQGSSSSNCVMLKESPFDEATFYSEPRAPAETWFLLPLLDPPVELRWVMGNDMENYQGGEEHVRHMVWRRPNNSSNTIVRSAGHFVPQQAPEQLAREIADVLIRQQHSFGQRTSAGQVQARL
ncbi:hypothetical protein DACRYDRAFT_22569 [Dacryopinax primogenitus]|uniref:AB hydrolase-1 domain-containing protein n=1 Tax=Dacryopinax primogenitus (strain DJM 731) TaxID=1858805 RepID=M5FZV8_DACPD|nr:uncharacterized protein DACRYDRAFT_22569 [Dacryopinax primogenitus]EJU01430.1 hypothetical protein DACRYDRAFT_22569 [Dacryopinax primogenitus]